MSEDKGQKTEKPTARKLREARKKGQVAQSREIVSTASILGIFLLILFSWQGQLEYFKEIVTLPADFYDAPFEQALSLMLDKLLWLALLMIAPFLLAAIVIAVLASVLQIGFLLSFESIKPDFGKLNPARGMKKIFSVKNLLETLKAIVKVIVLVLLLTYLLTRYLDDLVKLPYHDIEALQLVMSTLLFKLLIYLAPALIVIAGVDFGLQKWQFTKEQMMTKDERKREHKDTEGDPEIKGRRRQMQRKLASEDIGQQVRASTFVVVDGPRIAVALWYEKETTPLPMVMALGKDLTAKQIVRLAHGADKPIVDDPAVARALLEKTQSNQYIPADLIEEVAAVMREAIGV